MASGIQGVCYNYIPGVGAMTGGQLFDTGNFNVIVQQGECFDQRDVSKRQVRILPTPLKRSHADFLKGAHCSSRSSRGRQPSRTTLHQGRHDRLELEHGGSQRPNPRRHQCTSQRRRRRCYRRWWPSILRTDCLRGQRCYLRLQRREYLPFNSYIPEIGKRLTKSYDPELLPCHPQRQRAGNYGCDDLQRLR